MYWNSLVASGNLPEHSISVGGTRDLFCKCFAFELIWATFQTNLGTKKEATKERKKHKANGKDKKKWKKNRAGFYEALRKVIFTAIACSLWKIICTKVTSHQYVGRGTAFYCRYCVLTRKDRRPGGCIFCLLLQPLQLFICLIQYCLPFLSRKSSLFNRFE